MGRNGGTVPLPKPNRSARNKALARNSIVDTLYKSRLRELAMARFEWLDLPSEIDPRFLELTLNEFGMMAFFKDDIADQFVCLPAMIEGDFNVYMNPNRMRAWAINGYQRELTYQNSVPIFNNMLRTPTWPWLDYYAEQLYDIDQTRMVNVKAQKTPILLKGTDKQRLSLKNIYLEYEGNEPVILVDDSIDGKQFQAINMNAPFIAEQLTVTRRHIMGEALNYLGYQNPDATNKKERVLTGEIESSVNEAAMSRFSPLECRRDACDKINARWGLNISVNFRQGTTTMFDMDDPLLQNAVAHNSELPFEGVGNNE